LRLANRRIRDSIVPVEPRNFLDEVLLDREIEAIRWRSAHEVAALRTRFERQPLEDSGDRGRGNGHAQKPGDARSRNVHRIAAWELALYVDHRPRGAAAKLDDQLSGPIDRGGRIGEVDPALEAISGIRDEPKAPRLALDHGRVPEGALEEHRARG